MPRSAGVTASAVIVFIGSGFTIFCAAMMVLVSVVSMTSDQVAAPPGVNVRYILAIESVIAFCFGGWGIATGIGLIKTKQWARISLLIYAGILVFFTLPGAVVVAFMPLPNGFGAAGASLPVNFATIVRVFITLLYGAFAALGGFWLYFFNTRRVKAQFLVQQTVSDAAVAALPFGAPVGSAISSAIASDPRRPLSITIIGWYLLIASAITPFFLVVFSGFYRGVNFPLSFLGFFFYGRSAMLLFLAMIAAQIAAAIGLLKLKRWGLLATIGLQCLTLLNLLLIVAIPANRLKFQQVMDAMKSSMDLRLNHAYSLDFPAWIGMVGSLPIILVMLWFLVAARHAFDFSAEEPGNFGR